jgi:hypothetical protein
VSARTEAFHSERIVEEVLADWLADCEFPDYMFLICRSSSGCIFLQASYNEKDTGTGVIERQHTRRWLLSPEMVKSEVVATAFKCVLTSMEHRTREWFLYKGKPIYHPHYDVDKLAAITALREVRQ